ncbi:MAG: nucleotidyltransferase family protein [Gemmatimonadaceae bacterium]
MLRALILDTLSRAPNSQMVGERWAALRTPPRTFARLLATEKCASDLLIRIESLGLQSRLPPRLRETLTDSARRETARMLALKARLLLLEREFVSRNIQITLLKGAAYVKLGLRRQRACSDIDILVAAEDRDGATAAVTALGFRPAVTQLWADAHQLPAFHSSDGMTIDVHTRALYRPGRLNDERWATQEVAAGVAVLAPTDWCWHTLAHDAFHHVSSGSARSALDVACLIETFDTQIDWRVIAARAASWPDRVEPLIRSVRRLGYAVPFRVSPSAHLASICAQAGREYAARVAASDDLFVYAAGKIGGLLLGSSAGWVDMRRGPLLEPGTDPVTSMLRDAGRLTRIMLGRRVALV